ncbi:LuxR family transcriptional regulator [Mycobacterium sp. CBMA293]|uniref:LuxR C-terminal-related transcriptional regulator n=1 Tax=unclassified Mycolicibacterium TaxID=2636767 RepID=UPI0012DF1148|nr:MULTISPECIES: LuxR C-terminal-related transcriptional regulator [unclassified Mycolicibacterium]MUL49894.1 LuxR family transcriptional regulator [Mycolicibacterium sp. CBMA 360]MUL62713.1 LuxR family transcriptional regulator [Mycolicibacterium sp. CBMA 335]MUL70739.1 LuxR family transcriptional regulator [Mycolicibacterium sp. CBMA 311]MUL97237.1 LuxR family transcriptional regulator [Mycolicibacterium sp. CBMA 230]MUM07985.1 hypothetical protein [Mycolicibacterium sp. CBMA 213]
MLAPDIFVTKLTQTLERVRTRTDVALAFGGPVGCKGDVHLECFAGRTVGALPGVTLDPREGLGGKAVALRRPIAVNDYCTAAVITHKYDAIIQAERLQAVTAVPVIVGQQPIGIIYGGFRAAERIADRIQDVMYQEARMLEQEIVTVAASPQRVDEYRFDEAQIREHLRDACVKLRVLAARMAPRDRDAVLQVVEGLADPGPAAPAGALAVSLTRRELDVLAMAGVGMSNQQIAALLGLTLHTVKSYMKSTMRKLGATTRLNAVSRARSANFLP